MDRSLPRRSLAALAALRDDEAAQATLAAMADRITASMRTGGKLLIAGNGGSAADAQHMAARSSARFSVDRPALPAIALTVDSSILTAVGNDYGYEHVFRTPGPRPRPPWRCVSWDLDLGHDAQYPTRPRSGPWRRARHARLHRLAREPDDPSVRPALRAASAKTSSFSLHIVAVHVICGLVEAEMFANR